MCGVAAVVGIASTVLGIAQQYMSYQQAQADTRFYNAQRKLEWQGATLQAQSNRNTENIRQQMNSNFQDQTRALADIAFHNKSTGITVEQQQIQAKVSREKQERELESWEARGAYTAQARIGLSVDALLNDVKRQKSAADFLTSQNSAFAFSRTQQDRRVAQAARGSRIASARDYVKTTYLDPVRPLKKEAPGFAPYAIGMASSVLGGLSSYQGIESARINAGYRPGTYGYGESAKL
tara:strand:- start:326 stop:1036 length:711 start_codon:yes stop_codon:yes gene_type:complete